VDEAFLKALDGADVSSKSKTIEAPKTAFFTSNSRTPTKTS